MTMTPKAFADDPTRAVVLREQVGDFVRETLTCGHVLNVTGGSASKKRHCRECGAVEEAA